MTHTANKIEAFDLFEDINGDYLERARKFAFAHAARCGKVSINDVWEHCPPPVGTSHNALGAIFRTKFWKVIGFEPSKREEAHGRRVFIFAFRD